MKKTFANYRQKVSRRLLTVVLILALSVPMTSFADTSQKPVEASQFDATYQISLSEDRNDVTYSIPVNGMGGQS